LIYQRFPLQLAVQRLIDNNLKLSMNYNRKGKTYSTFLWFHRN